jgi:hypothetical protein
MDTKLPFGEPDPAHTNQLGHSPIAESSAYALLLAKFIGG